MRIIRLRFRSQESRVKVELIRRFCLPNLKSKFGPSFSFYLFSFFPIFLIYFLFFFFIISPGLSLSPLCSLFPVPPFPHPFPFLSFLTFFGAVVSWERHNFPQWVRAEPGRQTVCELKTALAVIAILNMSLTKLFPRFLTGRKLHPPGIGIEAAVPLFLGSTK